MARASNSLAIDARPRGPRGLLAVEVVAGQAMLDRQRDLAADVLPNGSTLRIHVEDASADSIRDLIEPTPQLAVEVVVDPPATGAPLLRCDRLYDRRRLARALRRGDDPEAAVFWRLDTPHGLAGASDELVRRAQFQPLGRYWALAPARGLARMLAPTRVRPNHVTLLASACFLTGAAVVAFGSAAWPARAFVSLALALALVLDTADGHLARLQGTASSFGRWLDGWLDEVADMALHAAVAWASYVHSGWVGWLLLGMLYAMGKFVFVAATSELAGSQGAASPVAAFRAESLARRVVRLAGHADVRWHAWIVLGAVGRLDLALAAHAAYFPARAGAVALGKAVRHG